MLHRVLGHVKDGFYIDVGAQDPVEHSVTLGFYELGWRGLNVEPSDDYHARLEKSRPEDINVKMIVSDHEGELTFYEFPDTGLSTTVETIAKGHALGGYRFETVTKPCMTLDSICAQHEIDVVHFLKVDVEGSEEKVLRGFSFETVRPWVLLVESVMPNTPGVNIDAGEPVKGTHPKSTHGSWEKLILDSGYEFAYFDGLNRFYVAEEKKDLIPAFGCPPNVFDDYILSDQVDAHKKAAAFRFRATALENDINRLLREIADGKRARIDMQRKIDALSKRLDSILTSQSWKLTAPVRRFTDVTKPLIRNVKKKTKSGVSRTARLSFRRLKKLPLINKIGRILLRRFPALEHKAIHALREPGNSAAISSEESVELTESAEKLFHKLVKICDQKKR